MTSFNHKMNTIIREIVDITTDSLAELLINQLFQPNNGLSSSIRNNNKKREIYNRYSK